VSWVCERYPVVGVWDKALSTSDRACQQIHVNNLSSFGHTRAQLASTRTLLLSSTRKGLAVKSYGGRCFEQRSG